jgi:copper transport protein
VTTPPTRARRRAGGLVAAVLVALCALLAGASPAAAHAQLVGTDPADGALLETAPGAVTLSFNEPVRLTDREITVYDAQGRTVTSEASTSDSDVFVDLPDVDTLGRGTFVVAWFVVSSDGNPISGSLTFSVGVRTDIDDQPPAPTSSGVVTRSEEPTSELQLRHRNP